MISLRELCRVLRQCRKTSFSWQRLSFPGQPLFRGQFPHRRVARPGALEHAAREAVETPLADLKTEVRKKVPEWVPVSLIEDSGRTTDL